jgi:hypothetical protein
MGGEYRRLPEETQHMTLEDFAIWILALPKDIKGKQIWFIDIGTQYKGKPLNMEVSPSGTHVSIEEDVG